MTRRIAPWVCLLLWAASSSGQTYETLRVATYNLLIYNTDTTRNADFRRVVRAVDPDILVVQEMVDVASQSNFLNNVLNAGQAGTYSAAPFVNGWDTDNSLFYKPARVSFIGPQTVLHTQYRDINGYRLRPVGVSSDSVDVQIYSAHFKASQGYESDRAAEAETLRTHLTSLPDGGSFIGAGDFNLYTSSEPAWTNLAGSRADNSGRLNDPINTPGDWHAHSQFAAIHTQATRLSSGGMDDRFDFVLVSDNVLVPPAWEYVAGSYTEYGNDGLHFNQSINDPPNAAVPDSIADALYDASDHLPVYLEIRRLVIPPSTLTITVPNGGEIWYTGNSYAISWTSQNLNGTVSIRLNRDFPGGVWQTLYTGTANDGGESWTVSSPVTTTARIAVISDVQPTVGDTSNGDFSIRQASISVLSPDGGELWRIGEPHLIMWSSVGVLGNVRVELKRDYPAGAWETLFDGTSNDGFEPWTVTGPIADHARVRISGGAGGVTSDTSTADFQIRTQLPVIAHDPHGDAVPGAVTFTARVTDDLPGFSVRLLYRRVNNGVPDSAAMTATGNPNEFAAAPVLDFGRWEYFIRVTDSDPQSVSTDSFEMAVSDSATFEIGYDDGSAELFNWAPANTFAWAVRFTPPQLPFVLCEAQTRVAGFHPDSAHSSVRVRVYSADGSGGMPGTVLREVARGSAGNVLGGLPGPDAYPVRFVLHDDLSEPLQINGDFYVAVLNCGPGDEAFADDTSSVAAGRSFLYDGCAQHWTADDGVQANTRRGNRMIRVRGWSGSPLSLTIQPIGNDVGLFWLATGSPYYRIYKSLTADFGGPVLAASVSDTSCVLPGELGLQGRAFYRVVSSSAP